MKKLRFFYQIQRLPSEVIVAAYTSACSFNWRTEFSITREEAETYIRCPDMLTDRIEKEFMETALDRQHEQLVYALRNGSPIEEIKAMKAVTMEKGNEQ